MRKKLVIGMNIALIAALFAVMLPMNVSAYDDHDPITIDGNSEFTAANGVTGGSGTQSDPYIIEDWEIDGGGSGNGILIKNTDVYFVIQNCYIHHCGSLYADSGIALLTVENGMVRNSICSNNGWNGITSMFGAILERILPWFEENWTWILGGLAAFFAGPSIISALTAAVGGLFGDLLGNLVGGEGGGGLFGSLLGGLGLGGAGEAAKAGAGGAGAETAVTATAETSAAINDAAGAGGFEGLITNLATILAGAEGVSLVIDKNI